MDKLVEGNVRKRGPALGRGVKAGNQVTTQLWSGGGGRTDDFEVVSVQEHLAGRHMGLKCSCSHFIHVCIHLGLGPEEGVPFPGLWEGACRSWSRTCGAEQGKLLLQGWEGRRSCEKACELRPRPPRAHVCLLASHLTRLGPALLVYKGKGQRHCFSRFPVHNRIL